MNLDDINIDPELFQLITLAGLALLFLLLLLALLRMTRIRRSLDRLRSDVQAHGETLHSLRSRGDESQYGSSAGTGLTGPTGAAATWDSQSAGRSWPSETAPAQTATPARSQEPFERDGRWWAYRGDELLVYDEGSGQWVPPTSAPGTADKAPTSGPDEGGGAGQAATLGGAAAGLGTRPEERPVRTGETTQTPTPSFATPEDSPSSGRAAGEGDTGSTVVAPAAGMSGQASGGLTQESAWPQREADESGRAATGERSQEPFERDGRWWAYRGDELLVYEENTGQWKAAAGREGGAAGLGSQPSAGAVQAPESSEPFERDGRWYFQRGGELLVHDEASGQWVPAGGESTSAAGTGSLGGEGGTATFWKCASCGAVNGSTATSCRMCFAPRP